MVPLYFVRFTLDTGSYFFLVAQQYRIALNILCENFEIKMKALLAYKCLRTACENVIVTNIILRKHHTISCTAKR